MLDTDAKSVLDAVPEPTDTVTVVAALRVPPFNVPVTVTVVPASSATVAGLRLSVTVVDGVSLSFTVTSTLEAVTLLAP